MNPGIAYALAAYLLWGVFPIYLHMLAAVPAGEVLAHRIAWSLVTVALLLVVLRRYAWIAGAVMRPALLGRFTLSSLLLSVNWLVYIWAVDSGHVVDASLGYFIYPLANVLLGSLLLHEHIRGAQKIPLALATTGVAWLSWQSGSPPWIGLTLAATFSLYSLMRKTAPLGALEGFAVETAVLAPLALAYLLWLAANGTLRFSTGPDTVTWMLAAAGPVTAVPLLLFAAAARRISLGLLGILQYLSPTLQWLCGVLLFHESFHLQRAIGFGLVWLALAGYALEGAWFGWRKSRRAMA